MTTTSHFHLFVYGTLRGGTELLAGCERVASGTVEGTLYAIGDAYPALIAGGGDLVQGEVWRCPASRLSKLDGYEGVDEGLFRRIGIRVGERSCWTYVAGPALGRQLTPERRIASGDWMLEVGEEA